MKVSRLARRLTLALILALSVVSIVPSQQAGAISHIGVMYFSGRAGTVGTSNCALIPSGYTGGANKANFINFILATYNTRLGGSGCAGGEKVSAAYIIQTMRGVGVGTNRFPTDAEIQDWENLINQPSVTISTNNYSYTIDTALKYTTASFPSGVDIGQFYKSGTASSTLFSQDGQVVYAMRNPCGNPVGQLPGIHNEPLDYTLSPSITANQSIAEAGSSVTLTPTISNSGHVATSVTQWPLSQFLVAPCGGYPGAGASTSAPAAYYGKNLTRLAGGTGGAFPLGTTTIGQGP